MSKFIQGYFDIKAYVVFYFVGLKLVDCRDPTSVLRFGFVEFADEECARNALSLGRTMLGSHTIRVEPSKTAITPADPTLLPRSEEERERCIRTICCTNIHRKVLCMRVLGDNHHPTRTTFVEFATAESAIAALNCSGVVMGSLAIRISPSKTHVKSHQV